ncbi:MAG TPA: alpha/beta hydrolase-fold protein [Thermoanaerobaculia bacterium]|nr:alpha/beta hydrolase-fold protein [Thermoanaerobaculia bacterium]
MSKLLVSTFFLLALPAVAQPYTVTFTIDMSQPIAQGWFDPATETVGVRGAQAPLSLGETLPAARVGESSLFRVTVTFPERPFGNQPVLYRFKVDGRDDPNRGWEENGYRIVVLSGETTVSRAFGAPGPPFPETLTGTIRVHKPFVSKHLDRPREVFVWLPPGYEKEAGRRYPVLYMHDGQKVFDAAVTGIEWQMDETAGRLVEAGVIEPLIIVGVNSTADRIAEYTPYTFERDSKVEGGKGRLYGRLLVEELKPFIDSTYRTLPDAAHTGLGGASLGGLITLDLGLRFPEVFGKLIIASPGVWWRDGAILKDVANLPRKSGQKIWLDIGTKEHDRLITGVRELRDILVAKGWKEGSDLRYVEAKDAGHDETAWAARVEEMLRFLFPRTNPAASP